MVSLHSALVKIYQIRSDPSLLPLTTPKILRQELSTSHGLSWDDEEWKGGQRAEVLKVWEGVLVSLSRLDWFIYLRGYLSLSVA